MQSKLKRWNNIKHQSSNDPKVKKKVSKKWAYTIKIEWNNKYKWN